MTVLYVIPCYDFSFHSDTRVLVVGCPHFMTFFSVKPDEIFRIQSIPGWFPSILFHPSGDVLAGIHWGGERGPHFLVSWMLSQIGQEGLRVGEVSRVVIPVTARARIVAFPGVLEVDIALFEGEVATYSLLTGERLRIRPDDSRRLVMSTPAPVFSPEGSWFFALENEALQIYKT